MSILYKVASRIIPGFIKRNVASVLSRMVFQDFSQRYLGDFVKIQDQKVERLLACVYGLSRGVSKREFEEGVAKLKAEVLLFQSAETRLFSNAGENTESETGRILTEDEFSEWVSQFQAIEKIKNHHFSEVTKGLPASSRVLELAVVNNDFLNFLQQGGHTAKGISDNQSNVELCRNNGSDVKLGFAGKTVPDDVDECYEAIYLTHNIDAYKLRNVLEYSSLNLKKGGLIFIETSNDQSLYASCLDTLTTSSLSHPLLLAFLLRKLGFSRIELSFTDGLPKDATFVAFPSVGDASEIPDQLYYYGKGKVYLKAVKE